MPSSEYSRCRVRLIQVFFNWLDSSATPGALGAIAADLDAALDAHVAAGHFPSSASADPRYDPRNPANPPRCLQRNPTTKQ